MGFDVTKNDLCSDRADLDYQALIQTAQIAYGDTLEEIHRHYSKLRSFPPPIDNISMVLEAHWLCREARALEIVAETLSTLLEGLKREEVVIVNREVKENAKVP